MHELPDPNQDWVYPSFGGCIFRGALLTVGMYAVTAGWLQDVCRLGCLY